jgi:flagellar motor switch protein FliN/FliY
MTTNHTIQARLTQNIESALSQALAGMTAKEFAVTAAGKHPWPTEAAAPFIWQQSISILDGPAFWLVADSALWDAMGRKTLEAAGIDAPSEEDIRSTWQEIVNQTASGFVAAIAANLVQDAAAVGGEVLAAEPVGLPWIVFTVSEGDDKPWFFKAAWSDTLTALYVQQEGGAAHAPSQEKSSSRTLDVLLEVAMPVCVSFGKTSLQIREVLKLNTGSIVELDRFVSDPVDVIVNDCVIARGEVVVVDGNYGVRITQLASREDRLRFGMREFGASAK